MTRLATIARRHRFGHAVLFAVTVCLLVGTASVDPLLTRSFRNALITFHAEQQGVSGSQVQFESGGTSPLSIAQLEKAVDPRVRAVTAAPIESRTVVVSSLKTVQPVRIQSTQDACAHVHLVSGRCPTARNEVMVAQAAVRGNGSKILHLGAQLPVTGSTLWAGDPRLNPRKTMRLVGIFTVSDDNPFWGGTGVGDYAPPTATSTSPTEYWLTPASTFAGKVPTAPQSQTKDAPPGVSWLGITSTVSYPVLPTRLNPQTLPAAVAGVNATTAKLGQQVTVFESLSRIQELTHTDVRQAGQILPFLLVQLGVVLLILLVQVTSYFGTARRGEAAVLKMRGNGTRGVVRFGAEEFLPSYVVGVVCGLGLAYVVDELVRRLWLPGDVDAAWNWTACCAALAMATLVLVVWLVCWTAMARQSISALLRVRPPRTRGARLSMPLAVLGTLCLIGVILTATKNLTGAPVQVTPVLLAGLVALVVGALLTPVAAWLVRRLLARRRAAGALAVAQLGRRAGVVTAVATLVITSALFTLSISQFARGGENRAARTAADLGAPAVINLGTGFDTVSGQALEQAVNSVDPHHRDFSPAVGIASATSESNAILGVVPSDLQRMGLRTGLAQPIPWSALRGGGSTDEPTALAATWTLPANTGSVIQAPTMMDVDGPYRVVGTAPYIPGAGARTLVVNLATMLASGNRRDNVTYQVFSATQNPHRIAQLEDATRKAGFASATVQTETKTRASYDATATAWAMNLSIVVSILSVFAALTSVVLVAVASRRDRQSDLRALRTGGVPRRVARAATVGEFALLTLLGTVIGTATAPLAALLTGPTMLWWSTPPAEPLTRTGFMWPVGVVAAAVLIVLLLVVATVFGLRLARAADKGEGRTA
ncbi:hypothetical protein [Flexivirga caeni]|uniref:ABC transporter permease n=1 Tax=Flexivirga caeni TaxID=2294115 RepID=A0A3M9MJQ2_9MICO|nr:hypothetical protein [Flexivirga caeni]RNI25093.1 hypothetical protein EFY87_00090 [Flexivirga caeni]